MYDGFKLIAEFDVLNSDEVLRQYAWSRTDLDTPMWMKSGGQYYYYQLDGNKNVVGLIDEAGALANSYEYSPFGKLSTDNETIAQPFKFSSEYADDETGLIYYNYRYYNPENGKWLKRDPIEEQGGVNLYGFVGNNSINAIDINGLKSGDFGSIADIFDVRINETYGTALDRLAKNINISNRVNGNRVKGFTNFKPTTGMRIATNIISNLPGYIYGKLVDYIADKLTELGVKLINLKNIRTYQAALAGKRAGLNLCEDAIKLTSSSFQISKYKIKVNIPKKVFLKVLEGASLLGNLPPTSAAIPSMVEVVLIPKNIYIHWRCLGGNKIRIQTRIDDYIVFSSVDIEHPIVGSSICCNCYNGMSYLAIDKNNPNNKRPWRCKKNRRR